MLRFKYSDGGFYRAYWMIQFMYSTVLCKAVDIPGYVYGVEGHV